MCVKGGHIARNAGMNDFHGLTAYQKAFDNAMAIFQLTKTFPSDEKFGLISQVRNSSRSVCACLAESYRKRQYPKHFVSKVSDADMENSETLVWLEFGLKCGYMNEAIFIQLSDDTREVGRLLNHMMKFPDKYSNR